MTCAVFKHALRPSGEAIDIGIVAAHVQCQHDAQNQRAAERDQQDGKRGGMALLNALRSARDGEDGERVQAGEQQKCLRIALDGRFRCIGGIAAGIAGDRLFLQRLREYVVGQRVQLFAGYIVKISGARIRGAVAAHAQQQCDFVLISGGAHVDIHVLPFAVRFVYILRIDERVFKGQRGGVSVRTAAGCANIRGKMIIAVRFNFDHLAEARVVRGIVDHGGAIAVRFILRNVQIAGSFVLDPLIARPADGHGIRVQLGKIAVLNQTGIGFLRRRGAAYRDQRQHNA